jgi:DNA-binding NarL/FixJ family response regulator
MNHVRAVLSDEIQLKPDNNARPHINVVLAESYPMMLAGIDHLLASHADLHVVARCADGEQALRAVREHRPDVLVSDLRLPGKNGLAVLRELTSDGLRTRVVLLAERIYEDEMLEVIRFGAKGVILKGTSGNQLVRCIRKVHAGETWLEKQTIGRAMEHLLRREAGAKEVALLLTPRELDVLRAVATGMRNKEISDRLHITEGTVKTHLHNVYEKLDVKGRLELILCARDRGWV